MVSGQAIAMWTIGGLVLCIVVAGCAGPGVGSTPDLTTGPPSGAAAAASPTAAPATPAAATKLTDDELTSITAGSWVPIPADASEPKVDAIGAEATVRASYGGARETIEVRRIAMRLQNRVVTGWVVGLTPQAGVPCILHPGLLPRAIEGGIVDDQTGEMFWTMTCG